MTTNTRWEIAGKLVTFGISVLLIIMGIGDYLTGAEPFTLTFEILTAFALALGALLAPDFDEVSIKDLFHLKRKARIEPASDAEIAEVIRDEVAPEIKEEIRGNSDEKAGERPDFHKRISASMVLEQRALGIYLNLWPQGTKITEGPIRMDLGDLEPILGRGKLLFDGHVKTGDGEQFIEVKRAGVIRTVLAGQLVRQLAAVRAYSKDRQTRASLILLLTYWPGEWLDENGRELFGTEDGTFDARRRERLRADLRWLRGEFSEAINQGLLRIEPVVFTAQDVEGFEAAAPQQFTTRRQAEKG